MIQRTALALACLIALPALARAEETADQRLGRLENDIRALRDDQLQTKAQLGLDGKSSTALVRAGGKESSLKLSGLLQVQSDFGDKGDRRFGSDRDRFYLRRARLNASGTFVEDFDFRVEGEFAGSLAETGAMRAQLTDGYIQWKKYGESQIRAGQFKTPFGYEQLANDPRLLTIERSLANDRLTLGRQVGLQVGGDWLGGRASYAVGAFNGTGVNSSSNDNERFTWVGRVAATPLKPAAGTTGGLLSLGANAFYSADNLSGQPSEFKFASKPTTGAVDNVFVGKHTGWGLDSQYSLGRFDLWAEYLRVQYEPDNNIPASQLDAEGWYAQAAFYILPGKLQGLLKYDTYDPNLDRRKDVTKTWTAGLNYYIKDHDLKLQLDYLRSDIDGQDGEEDKVLARVQMVF